MSSARVLNNIKFVHLLLQRAYKEGADLSADLLRIGGMPWKFQTDLWIRPGKFQFIVGLFFHTQYLPAALSFYIYAALRKI